MAVSWALYEGEADDGELTVTAPDTDDVARAVLALPGAHDLEITSSSLEDAFTSLTA